MYSVDDILAQANFEYCHSTNKSLFVLARGLCALHPASSKAIPLIKLQMIFDQWYNANYAFLPDSKGYDELLFDLIDKVGRVKIPLGADTINTAWERMLRSPYPEAANLFRQEELKQLTSLCWQLQKLQGLDPFFLSCRTVQRLWSLKSHTKAARWLLGLRRVKVLELVDPGDSGSHRASRYIFTGPVVGHE
jgi:hypothetical protein